MEDAELKTLWKNYDKQLEEARLLNLQSWMVNLQTVEYLQTHKVKSRLQSLAVFKTWVMLAGILWVAFLGLLLYGDRFRHLHFSISVFAILVFNIVAVVVYIRHIVLIRQINYTESVIAAQEKLLHLRASTINIVRILFLQTPFYCTWFWPDNWISAGTLFWLINIPVLICFTAISVWLFRNIAYRNAGKRWFRILFAGKEWGSVVDAISDLQKIEDFRQEIVINRK